MSSLLEGLINAVLILVFSNLRSFRYYDEIKKPMDFKTLLEKLNSGGFKTMEAFAEDMYLIFKNCRQFNPPGTLPVLGADIVEKAFKKEWGPIMRAKLTLVEKRNLAAFLERMRQVEECVLYRLIPCVASVANYPSIFSSGIAGSATQSTSPSSRTITTTSRNGTCAISAR